MWQRTTSAILLGACLWPAGAAAASAPRLFEVAPGETPFGPGAEAARRVEVKTGLVLAGVPRLHLDLPDGLEFEARRSGLDRRGIDSATWSGNLAGSRDSQVILSITRGVLSGWIHSRFGDYEIRPLSDGDSVVSRIELDDLPGCGPALMPAFEPQVPEEPAAPPTAADGPGRIDVLVLYTPQARDLAGGELMIQSRAQLMVDTANVVFANSQMSARLNLVHTALAPFGDTGGGESDLDTLRTDPQVAALRNEHAADLVALLVRHNGLCGIAYVPNVIGPGFAPWAYSVTASPCVTSFAHEIGHNFGFHHDPANAPGPTDVTFPWAYGHIVANDFRTIMAYPDPCGSCEEILHFSNPRVEWDGRPTGIEDQRDNARVGAVSAPVTARFRISGLLFADDFESGSFLSWFSVRGGLATRQPGLRGSALALDLPLTGSPARRFLAHRLAPPGDGVEVGFLINANNADLGGAEVALLEFFGKGQRHLTVTVRQIDGAYWLTLYAKANDDAYQEVGRTPLRAEITEDIEVIWRRASAEGALDGYVRLVKNGGPRGTLRHLDNDARLVREIRLGLPGGTAGAPPGTSLVVDDYRAALSLP
ncbi:MAG: zinc-dependent metalloprotease [Acidobacteriota bacterium]|nr:zinc-dependent metalloprotease [Acidobacteriota bacterium]MDH3522365.1 zinc-dependent metalloprotease [Acidobacteriota bacterium]